jgi:dihydropteroate synthase
MQNVSIMGILNITPDSFSEGGVYFNNIEKAVLRTKEMLKEGADIIDIGGESTRPGSEEISEEKELGRVIPVIDAVRQKLGNDFSISIDTNKARVADTALTHGANMVNSLGGTSFDIKLADVIKKSGCKFAIYHIKGIPRTMQQGEITYTSVIKEIIDFFEEQIALGEKIGIKRSQFIIDPGIGFGKNLEQNLEIIRRLQEFKKLQLPIMIGVSRKSHLGMLLKSKLKLSKIPPPRERLEASLAETAISIIHGATIIRTHDVSQTKKFITVLESLK